MISEILTFIFGAVVLTVLGYMVFQSTVILSYRSQLRKITGAYYDFEIDEVLKEWGMTREEALRKYGTIYGEKQDKNLLVNFSPFLIVAAIMLFMLIAMEAN